MNSIQAKAAILVFFVLNPCISILGQGEEVGRWKRFETRFENNTWRGNPFDIVLNVIFVSPTGKIFTQFGFYAAKDTWKVYFMPGEIGKWDYMTKCTDPELDGISGGFTCIESCLDAPLTPSGKQWEIGSGRGDFPVVWSPVVADGAQWGFRGRNLSDPMVQEALRFADETTGARLLGFGELVIVPVDWAGTWPQSAVPYVIGKEGDEFYLPFWDQLNAKLDAARNLNMGAYIMLYGDDAMKPDNFGISPNSVKELRYFRYVIARLACYPHILWDTGIDIGEYRKIEWIDWFADWFLTNDPWQHPVSSRSGGGSGGAMPKKGTYFSTGGVSIPSRSELLEFYSKSDVPVVHTDHWRPFISRGDWSNTNIRIAMWRCGLTGAQALYPDYNQGVVNQEVFQEGGKFIGIATDFFRNKLQSDLLELQVHDELIIEGEKSILTADPGNEYIIYDEDGGNLIIDLTAKKYSFHFDWYNPRTGETVSPGKVKGGTMQHFSSPTKGEDWVLHIFRK